MGQWYNKNCNYTTVPQKLVKVGTYYSWLNAKHTSRASWSLDILFPILYNTVMANADNLMYSVNFISKVR